MKIKYAIFAIIALSAEGWLLFLNRVFKLGYYRIDELKAGMNCSRCGKFVNHVFPKKSYGLICGECLKL